MKFLIFVLACSIAVVHGGKQTAAECPAGALFTDVYCEEIVEASDKCKTLNFIQCFGPKGLGSAPKACPGGYCKFTAVTGTALQKGECVSDPLTTCTAATTTNFACFNIGHVPDPTDCRKYYYCEDAGNNILKATQFDCAPGMMYNKVAKKCNLPFSAAFCNTVDCSNSNGDLRLMYSNSRQFWTQCITTVPGTPPTIIAGACADGFEVDFTPKNTLPPACIYRCRGSGYFPYSQDVKKYIQCYFSGWALKSIILNCEADWEFEQSAWGPWFSGCKPKKA